MKSTKPKVKFADLAFFCFNTVRAGWINLFNTNKATNVKVTLSKEKIVYVRANYSTAAKHTLRLFCCFCISLTPSKAFHTSYPLLLPGSFSFSLLFSLFLSSRSLFHHISFSPFHTFFWQQTQAMRRLAPFRLLPQQPISTHTHVVFTHALEAQPPTEWKGLVLHTSRVSCWVCMDLWIVAKENSCSAMPGNVTRPGVLLTRARLAPKPLYWNCDNYLSVLYYKSPKIILKPKTYAYMCVRSYLGFWENDILGCVLCVRMRRGWHNDLEQTFSTLVVFQIITTKVKL